MPENEAMTWPPRPTLALTLRHPWPWAICLLGKRIENRTWSPGSNQLRPGDWFAIHGGKPPRGGTKDWHRVSAEASRLAEVHGRPELLPGGMHEAEAGGRVVSHSGIVALARFGGTAVDREDPWFVGPVGWQLADLVILPVPVPCRGAQGLWRIPPGIGDEIARSFPDGPG